MQKLMNSNVSGIIIVPTVNNVLLDGYRELKDHGIKYVFCNRRVEGLNAPKVVGNDFYGSNLVTKYLLSKGWKKPAYISVPIIPPRSSGVLATKAPCVKTISRCGRNMLSFRKPLGKATKSGAMNDEAAAGLAGAAGFGGLLQRYACSWSISGAGGSGLMLERILEW